MLRRLKQWLINRRQEVKRQVRFINRDVSRLTVDEWRANKDMVARALEALRNPVIRQMIDTCRNTHYGNFSGVPGTEEKAFAWCRAEGYSICLNTFESLAQFEKPKEELIAEFKDPFDEEEAA